MAEIPNGVTLKPKDESSEFLKNIDQSLVEMTGLQQETVATLLDSQSTQNRNRREDKQEEEKRDKEEKIRNSFDHFFDKMDFSKVLEKTSDISTNLIDTVLGPLNLIVKPLEEGLGINFIDSIKEKISGIGDVFSSPEVPSEVPSETGGDFDKAFDNTILKDDRMTPNQSNFLSKGGVVGASAVYLGTILTDTLETQAEDQMKALDKLKEPFGGMDVDVSPRGLQKMVKSILPAMLLAAPAIIGLTSAALLKKDDIAGGVSQIKEGDILRGLETILIGDREKVTDENAGKEMGHQGLAYGLGALGVGTTLGLTSAVTAGGGLATMGVGGVAAAVGPALAAAFPPALIVAGIAATAKGIQAAWVNDWDTRSEEIVNETKAIFADDESTWWDKIKAGVGLFGKGLFGSIVGGLKEVGKDFQERGANIKEALTGDMPLPKRVLTLFKELNILDVVFESITDFFKGFGKVAGDYLKGILPEPLLNVIDNIGNFFGWIYDKTIGKWMKAGSKLAQEAWNSIKGFFGNIFESAKDGIADTFDRAKTAITGSEYYQKAVEVVEKVGAFFGEIIDSITGFVEEKFEEAKTAVTESSWYKTLTAGLEKIENFFGDMFDTIFGWTKEKTDEAKLAVSNALSRAKFEKEALGLSSRRGERDKVMQLVEDQFGGDMKAFNEAFKASGMDAWNKGFGELFDGKTGEFSDTAIDKLLEAKESTSVNDAIITKDGQVINTSPDDNLIATKSEPQFLRQEMSNISSPITTEDDSSSILKEQLKALMNLAKILENKSFNNVIANNGSTGGKDFTLIRGER